MDYVKLVASAVLILYPLQKTGTTQLSRSLVTFTLLASFAWFVATSATDQLNYRLATFLTLLTLLSVVNIFFPMSCVVLCGAAVSALPVAPLGALASAIAAALGALAMLVSKPLLLNWQVFGPPVIGGYLAFIGFFVGQSRLQIQ